jgi:hypothetical protein
LEQLRKVGNAFLPTDFISEGGQTIKLFAHHMADDNPESDA